MSSNVSNGRSISKNNFVLHFSGSVQGGNLNRPTAKFLNANVLTQWLVPVRWESPADEQLDQSVRDRWYTNRVHGLHGLVLAAHGTGGGVD
jgi:hypothetical protein